jgi:hypothetical protein
MQYVLNSKASRSVKVEEEEERMYGMESVW